jgi:hypothetical protein
MNKLTAKKSNSNKNVEPLFSWFKQPSITDLLCAIKNLGPAIEMLGHPINDPGTARLLLLQIRGYLVTRIDQIDSVLGQSKPVAAWAAGDRQGDEPHCGVSSPIILPINAAEIGGEISELSLTPTST